MRIISRDVLLTLSSTLIGIVIGAFIGYKISYHFYQMDKEESRRELKRDLIEAATVDIAHNTFPGNFPQVHDSTKYINSAMPWRKLTTTGIDKLYFNIFVFLDYKNFEEFGDLVNRVKLVTDDFNDRIGLRNLAVLLDSKAPTLLNPGTYHYYQSVVYPQILKLQNYLQTNYQNLVR